MTLISADAATIRDVRKLLEQSGTGADLRTSTVSTITKPVIAKTIEAIAAGDSTPKTARLMTMASGAIVPTGLTVRIRNVGSGAVPANTVVLTEPCGKLGQCFVRNATPVPPVLTSIERYTKFVSQLAPETGLETKAWTQMSPQSLLPNPWSGSNLYNMHSFVLQHYWNPLQTPTSIDANGNRIFDDRMQGIRFAIDGHSEPGLWHALLNQHFSSANNPVTGKSSILPTSTSHVALNLSQIQISNGQFWCEGGWSNARTTHYRVWIDGVDMTGIVALGSPFLHEFQLNASGARYNVGGLMPVSITAGSYQAKTVWFDLWVTVRTINRTRFHIGDPTLASSYFPACSVAPFAPHHRSRFSSANVNANRYVGDQYRITFSDNGPGGAETLDVASGDGWTLTESNTGFNLAKSGVGSINLNWLTEAPVLTCVLDSRLNLPQTGNNAMRYLPAGTQYAYRNDNNSLINYGEWNPQGTTVFNQVARALGSTYFLKGANSTPASFFTGFPGSITVEKL
jgi:hypothetical protein